MKQNRQETIADIVAQMRGRGEDGRIDRRLWTEYADRIEAAWERERKIIMNTPRSFDECVERARMDKDGWDDVY